ncbi:22563_t:CDS:2, partial [Dentiscutata erythropus]
ENENSSGNSSSSSDTGESDVANKNILGILKKEIQVEPHFADIIKIFNECKINSNDELMKENIMDLSLESKFVEKIPLDVYEKFIRSSETYDKLIPKETHDFLVDFFSQ